MNVIAFFPEIRMHLFSGSFFTGLRVLYTVDLAAAVLKTELISRRYAMVMFS